MKITTWFLLTVQNKSSVYKILLDILDLCTDGSIDLEMYYKHEVLKIIYSAHKTKAAYPLWLILPRTNSPLS